ncbi:succinylglutamate desuccinylase/aspartoacylase family protein [uncultured Jatrophihabitans sp.]|uniref:succinylglutamate desuccinylase/aspartoacylase domain-containing protein n=1 Tax=uncultured Jatrophihabitans sp. TaxID=1610747 RepID=UPI0035CB7E51
MSTMARPLIRELHSRVPGPRVAIVGGVHGDETAGPRAISAINAGNGWASFDRGTVVTVLANLTACKFEVRSVNSNSNALFSRCRPAGSRTPEYELASPVLSR